MFGLFAPKCPLDTLTKTWIERRMLWLAERFGLDRLKNATLVTPTPDFFPDPYTPDDAGFGPTARRVCGYMGVDPDSVQFVLADDNDMPEAAGLYEIGERSTIYVARSRLAEPVRLVAVLAHELAHELLLKGGHISREVTDHEQVTDLLPVFLGMGIFGANGTVREETWRDPHGTYSLVTRQGYLTSLELGYALAVFAHARGEASPKWVKHLRPDAGVTLKTALGYLRKTNDTLFRPNAATRRETPAELADDLADPSPTVRLNALWQVEELTDPHEGLLAAVEPCFKHTDAAVRLAAVRTVGRFGAAAGRLAPRLIDAMFHADPPIRVEAAVALGRVRGDADHVIPALTFAIGADHPELVSAAAAALVPFGRQAAAAEPKLMAALEAAGHLSDESRVKNLIAALLAVCTDAPAKIRSKFTISDPELRRAVIGELLRQTR